MSGGSQRLEVAVIGAGWAGLAISRRLAAAGSEHLVFERGRIGESWKSQRWDSFHMNTPNILNVLPGEREETGDPEGYMPRAGFVAMIEGYAKKRALPVIEGTDVSRVRREGDGFLLETGAGAYRAGKLVVASGNLNVPRRPQAHRRLPTGVLQIDGTDYRNASALPAGAVLVIGSGNTGGQIAEDLALAGRQVYLSTGRNGRLPRRYRGRDTVLWLIDTGRMARPRPSGTGRALLGATHSLSLQLLSERGVVVLGRLNDVAWDGTFVFDDGLEASLRFADEAAARVRQEIDAHIAARGLTAPPPAPDPADLAVGRFPDPPITRLSVAEAGIATVIWAVGMTGDFGWLKVEGALDARGQPVQDDGISVPGVFFLGLDTDANYLAGTVHDGVGQSARLLPHLLAR